MTNLIYQQIIISILSRPLHPIRLRSMMNMFKKYLIEMEGKDAVNHVNLYLDVDAYFSLADAKNARQKKDAQANTIYKYVIRNTWCKKMTFV